MKPLPVIEGELVRLDSFTPDYVLLYSKWLQDPCITKMVELFKVTTLEDVISMRDYLESAGDISHFLIFDRKTNKLIGDTGLTCIKPRDSAESDIMIAEPDLRNKGYGSEAYKLLIDYGFNDLRLQRIVAQVLDSNEPLIKLHRKVGFSEYGIYSGNIIFELYRD